MSQSHFANNMGGIYAELHAIMDMVRLSVAAVQPISEAVVLSLALPPITAKLVAKIKLGLVVAMKELLADNMSLCHQLESFPAHQHLFVGAAKPD